uniref:High mobility group protein n=1 Tax=Canavalia gladiata TaxID=3824 RepID=Q42492_CANGL|nr:high mobility group protein [Canavalia gladiata]BAA13134.1 high mobility group protein [Canavalia gladiata]
MATEEVNKPPSLPPYTEMITKALDSLNEPNGSNKSAISKYIESTCGELPDGHSTLLAHHLNKMKESGELVFLKNNYMKPDPTSPPKRGRGRPPKPKVPLPPGTVLSPPRPRGRPPKDPNAPTKSPKAKVSTGSGRPRGRPKKIARSAAVVAPTPGPSGRPRGRPPKVKPQLTEVSVES